MIRKRLVGLFLAILVALSTLSMFGCGDSNPNTGNQGTQGGGKISEIATVWSALSSEIFIQDILPTSYSEAKLDYSGIKGETESMQLMITAKKYVKGFDLVASDLTDGNGNVISKDNVKIYAEGYVEVTNPYVNTGNTNVTMPAISGMYPDALIPIKNYKAKRQDRIEAGNNQGIWIDVEIPQDAEAGNYTGSFTLTLGADNETMQIPVTLKVYDIDMPIEVHSRSAFNIWYSQIASGEKSNYDSKTNQIYYDFLLEKRLCSSSVDPNKRVNIGEYINYMVELALNPKVTSYQIQNQYLGIDGPDYLSLNAPGLVGKSNEEKATLHQKAIDSTYNGLTSIFTRILAKNLEKISEYPELNMFKKLVFYFQDEPTVGYRTETVKKFNEVLTKVKRDFIANNEQNLELYPEIKESIINDVKDMTPTHLLDQNLFVSNKDDGNGNMVPDYEKGDGVTLWVLHCYKLNSSAAREIIKQRQAYGEQFWWYTCCRTSPALSYYVESKTMNMRLQGWQQYEYGLEGILYWDIAQWGQLSNPYDCLEYSGYGSGEGILVYPGYDYGLKKPVSSIRLENIFQAQEDYEYLYMLNEYVERYNTENGTEYDVQELVSVMIADMHNGTYITDEANPSDLESCRIRILNILQAFKNGNEANAISLLQSELA